MPNKIRFPIDNFSDESYPQGCISQYYAENPQLYTITRDHSGWDIIPNDGRQAYGLPIFAMYDGTVVELDGETSGYGNAIRTMRSDGLINIYGHCSKVLVTLGQKVTAGAQIGEMGNSGFVVSGETPFWHSNPYAGTHLHVTFIPTCPVGQGQGPTFAYAGFPPFQYKYYSNGDLGAVNPAPYFADKEGQRFPITRDLKRGDAGQDVMNLGMILWMEGLFGFSDVIGMYGPKMQRSVFQFQRRYKLVGPTDPYQGYYCGPKTRAQLSILYP